MHSKLFFMFAIAFTCCPSFAVGQELENDDSTLLLLRFDGSANGEGGETPTANSGNSYVEGIHGQAIQGGTASVLRYLANDNLSTDEGTFEAWVKPSWAGNDGTGHTLLSWDLWGGFLIEKDGGNYFKLLLNRFAPGALQEAGVGVFAGTWQANQWKHIAFTWSDSQLNAYVDGRLVNSTIHSKVLNSPAAAELNFLSDAGNKPWLGDIDELRISDRVRSANEIFESFLAGVGVTGLVFDQPEAELYPTWRHYLTGRLETTDGNIEIEPGVLEWSSTHPSVATFDVQQGYITAHTPGTATLTATLGNIQSSVTVTVATPILQPDMELNIDPFLANPVGDALHIMPVVMITYLPTNDGVNVDFDETDFVPGGQTITDLKAKVSNTMTKGKFALEERTRFRGYKNESAVAYLGYKVIKHIYVYEPIPRLKPHQNGKLLDYWPIMKRFGIEEEVNNNGVKDVWINAYHTDAVAGWESNMSSPTTGDISNSDRSNDDLPICDQTYMVYWYNYARTEGGGLHNHGHQLEAIFGHLNHQQDGNTKLFWCDFVGRRNNGGLPPLGRVGDTHHPPNTTIDYDYLNLTPALSDIEDWQPSGGPTKVVSALTWGSIDYDWPYGDIPDSLVESNFYIYWMQNMPGLNNQIPHGDRWMENWWRHVYDWDASIIDGLGLHTATPPTLLGDANQDGVVNFSDIPAFIAVLQSGVFQAEADCNEDGVVDFSDIPAFIAILIGS